MATSDQFRARRRGAAVAAPLAVLAATIAAAAGPPLAGPAAVTPDMVGRPVATADQMARLSGLELAHGVFYVAPRHWREELRPRCVHLQSPPAGTPVPRGGRIAGWTLVEAGPDREIVSVPDLDGLPLDAAVTKLEKLGLVVMPAAGGAERTRPSDEGEGLVVDAYPRAGQAVYAGTAVFLVCERP